MKISFRLRIALLSLLLTGIALFVLCGFSWWQIRESKIARLDTQINNLLILLTRNPQLDRLEEHEERLAHLLGDDEKKRVFLLAFDDNQLIYNSSRLSKDELTILPWPMETQRPLRREWMDEHIKNHPPAPPVVNFVDIPIKYKKWHTGLITTPNAKIAIGVDNAFIREEMRPITGAFIISIPSVLLLVSLAAWLLAGRALKPVTALTQTMQQLSSADLHARVNSDASSQEFAQLITVFNELLARLEGSFKQAIRFSGDAAHELKTPLAVIQGQLERAIQSAPTGSELQENLTHALDEARRITAICRKLLLLSQADAGKLNLHYEEINITQMLEELFDDARLLAPALEIKTAIDGNLTVRADRDLLQQALQNLITNAIKYNIPNGWLSINAQAASQHINIEVKNSSHGLDQSTAQHLFERFYRGNQAHNREIDGVGLGLSITQEIIKAHGGMLTLNTNTENETGFLVELPKSI